MKGHRLLQGLKNLKTKDPGSRKAGSAFCLIVLWVFMGIFLEMIRTERLVKKT